MEDESKDPILVTRTSESKKENLFTSTPYLSKHTLHFPSFSLIGDLSPWV